MSARRQHGKSGQRSAAALRRDRLAFVRDGQAAAVFPAPGKTNCDCAAGGIFPGVVEIDLHKLAKLASVAADHNVRLQLCLERQTAFKQRGLEQQRAALGDLAEITRLECTRSLFVLGPRQFQKPLDQRTHLLCHGVNAGKKGLLLRCVVVWTL